MSRTPDETTRVIADPTDSVLLSLARAVAGGGTGGAATWPKLDLGDAKQREFGDYELLDEIGRGGMGVVYRARQLSLDRDVAIKFIADWFADPSAVARFLAEARAAARLMHPNIVPVHEVGSVDGMHYFSMPLIRGRSLASMLDAGTLQPADAIALLLKLCEAIDYAHRLGLLHLDLKPTNVLIDAREEPLIADFGLARHMDEKGGVDAQEVSGTPAFMAPEQILIKQYRLTPATDIYAIGAILYRCLTGVSPHGEGNADDVIRRAAAGRIRPPRELKPSIPRDLDAICMKCLELQPSDRYASAAHLADDLRRARDGLPVSVRRIGAIERAQRWFKREPRLAAATTIATLALLIGAVATTWQWKEAVSQRDAARRSQAAAAAERDRALYASALGAWLYAQGTSTYKHDYDVATRMLQWLQKKMPGDEAEQASVLTSFIRALDKEKQGESSAFTFPLIEVMGSGYRKKVIAALEASDAANRYTLAARLAWFDERKAAEPKEFSRLLDRAIAAQPDNPEVWNIAATFCTGPSGAERCRHPEAIVNLIRTEPDNMYPWLLMAMSDRGDHVATELHEAAMRSRFDDHFRNTFSGYLDAINESGVAAPALLTEPISVFKSNGPPEPVIAKFEAAQFPLANWQPLSDLCNPSKQKLSTTQAYADCLTIGERMVASKASTLVRMIGTYIVRRLVKGTPIEQRMIEYRRNYDFLMEMRDRMSLAQENSYPSDKFLADVSTQGELEALTNMLASFGYPLTPPAGWQPSDPNKLLLPEERAASSQTNGK